MLLLKALDSSHGRNNISQIQYLMLSVLQIQLIFIFTLNKHTVMLINQGGNLIWTLQATHNLFQELFQTHRHTMHSISPTLLSLPLSSDYIGM